MRPVTEQRRGRASGRVTRQHVEFALASDKTTVRVGLVESSFGDRWYLTCGAQANKAATFDGTDVCLWRALDAMIRQWLPHPHDRSDFCCKLLAVFAHTREYGPARTPLTQLVWDAFGDLVDTYAAG